MRNPSTAHLPTTFSFHSRGYVSSPYAESPTSGSYISFLPHEEVQSSKPKKPRRRRTFSELNRDILCPHADCGRAYASKHALNLHLRLKHGPPQGDGPGRGGQGSGAGTPRPVATHTGPRASGGSHHNHVKAEPTTTVIHPALSVCTDFAAMDSPEMPDSPRTPASVTTVSSNSADSLRDFSEIEELFAIQGSLCADYELQDLWTSSPSSTMGTPLLEPSFQWHALPPARAAAPLPLALLCNDLHLESLVQEHAAQLC